MSDDVRARLEKLLRLATNNPHEEEARSAALKFCRVFVEHQARIALDAPAVTEPTTPFTPPVTEPFDVHFEPARRPHRNRDEDLWREQVLHAQYQQQAANRAAQSFNAYQRRYTQQTNAYPPPPVKPVGSPPPVVSTPPPPPLPSFFSRLFSALF